MTDRDEFQKRILNICRGIYKETPYIRLVPCSIEDIDEGWVRLKFEIQERFCNYRGIASGGILAAFCDTLMGTASRSLGFQVTTLEINMNYVRPVSAGHYIIGVGQVVHHGGRTIVTDCECFDADGHVVVKGRASFYILRKFD